MRRITCLPGLALLSVVLLLGGCGGGNPAGPTRFICPSESDTLTWTSYGSVQLKNAGYDNRQILSDCGWHVYNNHNGGIGGTYQVASPSEGVILIWAYGIFSEITVRKGWTGATKEGVKLGDSMSAFLALYPQFTRGGPVTYLYNGTYPVRAEFDDKKNLMELYVGTY